MNLWCEQCVSLWMYARAKPLDWPGRLIKGMTIQYNTYTAILARAPNKGGDWQASLWRHCQTLPGGRCLFLTLIIFFLPLVLYIFYQWELWPENLIFWGILHFTNKQIWDQKNKETTWPQIIIRVPDISLNSKHLLKKNYCDKIGLLKNTDLQRYLYQSHIGSMIGLWNISLSQCIIALMFLFPISSLPPWEFKGTNFAASVVWPQASPDVSWYVHIWRSR